MELKSTLQLNVKLPPLESCGRYRYSINSIYENLGNAKYRVTVKRGNGHGHLNDDSSAPSLHGKNREIGAKEVNIKVSMPFRPFPGVSKTGVSTNQKLIFCDLDRCHIFS